MSLYSGTGEGDFFNNTPLAFKDFFLPPQQSFHDYADMDVSFVSFVAYSIYTIGLSSDFREWSADFSSNNPYAGGTAYRRGSVWEGSDLRFRVRPIPEPATILLLGAGLVGLASFGRKKLRKKE